MIELISVKFKNGSYQLYAGGSHIGNLNKHSVEMLYKLTECLLSGPKKKNKRIKKIKKTKNNESQQKAKQFGRVFAKFKSAFYKNKKITDASVLTSNNLKHFIKAVELCERHKVTYKKFMESQVDGLKDVSNGRHFPYVTQLHTDAAESRLLAYISKGSLGNLVELTYEDKQTPLDQNMKYLTRRERVKAKEASLVETQYVAELQKLRLGEVKGYVKKHLKKVRK